MARDLTARSQRDNPRNYEYRTATDLSQPQVNWITATDKINSTVAQIAGDRQKRRDETNRFTNESLDALSAATEYDNVNYTQSVMEMGYQGSDLLYGYYNQIGKNGYTQRQYKADVQNVLDGMSTVKEIYSGLETYYADITSRTEGVDGEQNNIFEQYLGNSLLGYTNAGEFRPMFDPSGNIVMVQNRYDRNGKLLPPSVEDRDATQSANTMLVKMGQRSDYVNAYDEAAPLIEKLGKMIEVQVGYNQSALSIEDWTRKEYKDPITGKTISNGTFLNNLVSELTESPEAKISILQTYYDYDESNFTEDPEVAANDKSKVLVERNRNRSGMSVMVFNDEQEKQIRETGRDILLSGIDYEEKFQKGVTPAKRPEPKGYSESQKSAIGYIEQLDKVVSGTADEAIIALDQIKSAYNAEKPANEIVSAERKIVDGRQQFIIKYQDLAPQVVDSRNLDGTERTTEDITGQLFEKMNYTNVNAPEAYKLYAEQGGVFGEETAMGRARSAETVGLIELPDIESNVILSMSYVDKKGDEEIIKYTDQVPVREFISKMTRSPIKKGEDKIPMNTTNFQRLLRAVVNDDLKNAVGINNIIVEDEGPTNVRITVGDSSIKSINYNGYQFLKDAEKVLIQETNRINKSLSSKGTKKTSMGAF